MFLIVYFYFYNTYLLIQIYNKQYSHKNFYQKVHKEILDQLGGILWK